MKYLPEFPEILLVFYFLAIGWVIGIMGRHSVKLYVYDRISDKHEVMECKRPSNFHVQEEAKVEANVLHVSSFSHGSMISINIPDSRYPLHLEINCY